MSVTKKITRLENSAVRLEVTVPQDELRVEYEKAVNEIARTIQIPGFRKGKVPRNVLERKLGAALKEDVFNKIVGETVKGIIEDDEFPKELRPLSYSSPVLENEPQVIDFEKDLTFSTKWDAQPQVNLETWKGLTVEVPAVEIEDADIARELEQIRERNSTVMDRSLDDEARNGDIVTVSYAELDKDNVSIPGTQREGFVFTLGSLANIYHFDKDIVGMKIGDTRIIKKDFPVDYENPDFAGKSKVISITVTAIKENKLPDLNDDLAQDVHEKFQTLDDLKNDLRRNLTRNLESRLDEQKYLAIIEEIIAKNPVAIPESMVQSEMNLQFSNLCKLRGMKDDQILKILRDEKHPVKAMMEGQRPDAVKRLQVLLVQQKLMEMLNIGVNDDERKAECKSIAERQEVDVVQVEEFYSQDDRQGELDDYISTRKLQDVLFKENTVNVGAKQSYIAFMGGDTE
jgi:trigger factor